MGNAVAVHPPPECADCVFFTNFEQADTMAKFENESRSHATGHPSRLEYSKECPVQLSTLQYEQPDDFYQALDELKINRLSVVDANKYATKYPNLLFVTDAKGRDTIQTAIEYGNFEMFRLLIQKRNEILGR